MRSKPIHLMALAHHRPEHADRCVHLPLGARQLSLCARCLGLYPVAVVALALQWVLDLGPMGSADLVFALVLALPALLDWGAGALEPHSGSNFRRLLTGALLGVALGRSLWLNARDPYCEVLWIQLFLLGSGALAFLLVRRLRPEDGSGI